MQGSCEHGNELDGSINAASFWQLLEKAQLHGVTQLVIQIYFQH
jgi:predicted deacylase